MPIALVDPRSDRVVQVEPGEVPPFEVAPPLRWVIVPAGLPVDTRWFFDGAFLPPFRLFFRKADGVLFAISRRPELLTPPGFDPTFHFFFDSDREPDRRTERGVEATSTIRAATAAEIAAFDDERKTGEAGAFVDDKRQLATLIFLIRRLNELRQQPAQAFPALTPAQVRQGIIDEFKALPE
jgi:hypothetical protein